MMTPTVSSPVATGRSSSAARSTSAREPGRLTASDSVWTATFAALLVLVSGAMSLATKQPWLFAALGPTILLVAASPEHPSSRFHSIVVGHAGAFLCGWVTLLLCAAADAPSFLTGDTLAVARVWASGFAIAATSLLLPTLRAFHPPAAATALLITLGVYRVTWKTSLAMLAGVIVVALLGEWYRRFRSRYERARA
jgi:CBS-domain-containing membrane protein